MGLYDFRVGDVVVLKSGGPDLTIVKSNTITSEVYYFDSDGKLVHLKGIPTQTLRMKNKLG